MLSLLPTFHIFVTREESLCCGSEGPGALRPRHSKIARFEISHAGRAAIVFFVINSTVHFARRGTYLYGVSAGKKRWNNRNCIFKQLPGTSRRAVWLADAISGGILKFITSSVFRETVPADIDLYKKLHSTNNPNREMINPSQGDRWLFLFFWRTYVLSLEKLNSFP